MEENKQLEFNSGKAWAVMISLFIIGIAMAWGQNKILPVVTIIMADLNVSAAVAGWISSIFGLMGIVLAFPAAGMIRKIGVRASIITSVVVSFAGAIIGFFAPNEIVLLIGRVVEGFGVGGIGVCAPACIAMWFPIEKRGLPMGIWSAWQIVAVAGVYLFTGTILGPDGAWKNMYIVGFVALVLAVIVCVAFVREPKAGVYPNYADSSDNSVSLTGVFKHPSIYILGLAGVGFGIAIGVFCTWIPSYWDATGAMPLLTGNAAIGYIYLGEIFACIFGGLLLNKIKKRQRFFAIIGVCYAVVLWCAYHTGGSFVGAVVICVLYFIFEGCFVAGMWTLVPQTMSDPRLAAGAIALFTMFNQFGMMLGSPISGAILDATAMTGWGYLALVAGGCQLIAGILAITLKLYNEKGEVIPR